MPDRAHITSVEALEAFRTRLILYLDSAQPVLDEIRSEIVRARLWLESDRQKYWESQIRRREQLLQDAEAEFFRHRLSNASAGHEVAQAAVRRARAAVEEAREKLKVVKRWIRQFDQEVDPFARAVDRLRDTLADQLSKAVTDLTRTTNLLADYAGIRPTAPPPTTEDTP